ncbi:MAG: TonB-dependent receptor [Prevotella sp.]|nr:TonB-dependent receptor [Prevotella sp.]MBQ1799999.1 TonB-dependent receptor [Prevotella sp.]MBQ2334138.1 TonB-dependent receptor [Prevotella sp.]MBQ2523292.1 TonB-dependent receptor [Prevotella sp.]MBQ5454246.1 TonB-dependent receptor [Prevotella sp.]
MKDIGKMHSVNRSTGVRRFLFLLVLAVTSTMAWAQGNVSGKVVDATGEPVIGASVVVKGTTTGAVTDIDGNFSIPNVPRNANLEISYIGFKTQSVSVSGKNAINVTLQEDRQMLDDVVVVGYGVQKKSDVTGAMASVSTEELNARPVNNALEALQGKAAGVDITTNERPGSLGSIRIRGERSLTAGNAPLYVVDGVPLMSASAIETLNPRDIETIDILKDASATAIYGSRGANGVVLVTTKQGRSGQMRIDYTGTLTVSNIVDRSPSMSAADFIDFRRWAAYNLDPTTYAHPNSPTLENDKILFDSALDGQTSRDNVLKGWAGGTWDPSKVTNTNWTDFVTQTAISHEHTLAVSGGSEAMNAYASFGYLSNKGTQKGQWYDRYTGKISVNINPTKWFSIQASINGTWSEQDYGMSTLGGRSGSVPDAIYGTAKQIYNIAVPYDANGNVVINPGGESGIYTIMNEWNHSQQKSQTFRALGNFAATIDFGKIFAPVEGLRYKLNFGPDFRHWREGVYIDGFSAHKINADGSEGVNFARLNTRRDFSWTLDNMIMFDRTFAEKHKVGVTLLQTASKWNVESNSMQAQNIAKDSYLWNAFNTVDVTNSDNKASISSGLQDRQLESYMIRLNYGFNERYLLTVSGRWDGASQLADGHKWDFFPSAALAWRASEEDFLKNVSWLSNLKLRLGIGVTGNSSVAPYETKGDIQQVYLPFNGRDNVIGYTTNEPYYTANQKTMANPELGWEKTTQWNLGIDYGFLNSRIFGSLDFYWSRTNDLIMGVTIPTLTGFPSTTANVGKSKNHGVEFTLNAIPVQTKDFQWETVFNIAYQKDEIVELAYGKNDMPDNSLFIGESLSVFYGYANDGLWQESDAAEMAKWNANGYHFEAGNVRPHDTNGDYKMTQDDRVILGRKNPSTTMGWNNTFSWRGVELGIQMFGRMGYMFNTGGEAQTAHGNQREIDYWTPTNTGADYQKPILGQATSGSKDDFSSLLGYQKASFLKVRNISLGYNFPKNIIHKAGFNHLKAYAQVINPFSLKQSIHGFDLDTGRTIFNRSFVFGLEVGF